MAIDDINDLENNQQETEKNNYLLIVQVFDDVSNAINYTYSSDIDLQYKKIDARYYVYIYSNNNRNEVEKFRDEYQGDCWILDPK